MLFCDIQLKSEILKGKSLEMHQAQIKHTQDRGMIPIFTNFFISFPNIHSNLQIFNVLNWVERHNKYLATGPEQSSVLVGLCTMWLILVSSQFNSLRILLDSQTILQEAHGPDVDAELLIWATNVHGGNIHNRKSCCFLCPVLKHCLAPVAICLLQKIDKYKLVD